MGQFHWDPDSYLALMRSEMPDYEQLQAETAAATGGVDARRILELGTGTGETTARVLAAHPGARLHGIDASTAMLATARTALAGTDAEVELELRRLDEQLPWLTQAGFTARVRWANRDLAVLAADLS
jgi:tRNA (cmo5U34)-methyltransferase